MKVVCGLGNPGTRYLRTRHNVGWWLVDALAARWGADFRRAGDSAVAEVTRAGETVLLLKPLTFMNRSGEALVPLAGLGSFQIPRDLLVVVDDAALPVGALRLRPRGSSGGHNGLRSIEAELGTQEYARLRIGVGRCPEGADLSYWVLSELPAADEASVRAALDPAAEGVALWLEHGVESAMNRINQAP